MQYDSSKFTLVSVSGIIGAGKSTLLRAVGEYRGADGYEIVPVYEPVDEWRKSGMLQRFYGAVGSTEITEEHRESEVTLFQLNTFITRVARLQRALQELDHANGLHKIVLMERHMHDDLMFWRLQLELLDVSPALRSVYDAVYAKWAQLVPPPDAIVYLRVPSIETALDRMQLRGRSEEGHYKQMHTYQTRLRALHDRHVTAPLAQLPDGRADVPCLHIDASAPYHECEEVARETAESIVRFAKSAKQKKKEPVL